MNVCSKNNEPIINKLKEREKGEIFVNIKRGDLSNSKDYNNIKSKEVKLSNINNSNEIINNKEEDDVYKIWMNSMEELKNEDNGNEDEQVNGKQIKKEIDRDEKDKQVINCDINELNEIQEGIFKEKKIKSLLKLFILNCQTINRNEENALVKKNFIKQYILDFRPDILNIIDVGKKNINNMIIPNYVLYNNGRDILGVFMSIKESVQIEEEIFIMKDAKMAFCYIRPNETNKAKLNKVYDLLKENFMVTGDLNLKSNQNLANVIINNKFNVKGEQTGQTVIINDLSDYCDVEEIPAPSDHNLIICKTVKEVRITKAVKIQSLSVEETEKVIRGIMEGSKVKINTTIKQIKQRPAENCEEVFMKGLLEKVINQDTRGIYKYYNFLWKDLKREPFLGTFVNEGIKNSLKDFYEHKDDKKYEEIIIEDNVLDATENLELKNQTYSKAVNQELINLDNLDKTLSKIWTEVRQKKKEKEAINNFLKFANKYKDKLMFKTFFLIKNKQLKTFNDVRIIVVTPTIIKIWEDLIYEKVRVFIEEEIDAKGIYQFGGKKGSSTYQAILNVQTNHFNLNGNGLIYVDIAKGYDNVKFDILREDINQIQQEQIRSLLKVWLTLVSNCDVNVNNDRIKKTKGIAMGLTLSPLVFNWYTHKAVIKSNLRTNKITMYIDDLALVITKEYERDFDNIKREFNKRGLIFNMKKCSFITNDDEVKNKLENMELKKVDTEKYLGKSLKIDTNRNIIGDNRFLMFNDNTIALPNFSNLIIKKLIVEGAILARLRYVLMMKSLEHIWERAALWRFLRKIYMKDFKKLSYAQLVMITGNILRYCIDMRDLVIIKENVNKAKPFDVYKETNDQILKKITTGIDIIDKSLISIDFMENANEWEIDLEFLKIKLDEWWSLIKRKLIANKIKEKIEDVKVRDKPLENTFELLSNKLFNNYKVMMNIILRHLDFEKKNIIAFIKIVLKDITNCIEEDKEIAINSRTDIIFLNVTYKDLDREIIKLQELTLDNKIKKYRKELNMWLSNIDYIIELNNVNKLPVEDLVTFLRARIAWYKEEKMYQIGCDETYIEIDKNYKAENSVAVDGSFNKENKQVGAGVIFNINNFKRKLALCVDIEKYKEERNITGEMFATLVAINIAVKEGIKEINIIFDYIGLYFYSEDKWACNSEVAKVYNYEINELKKKININWKKVKSHTDYYLNDEADKLAKIGAGIIIENNIIVNKVNEKNWKNII